MTQRVALALILSSLAVPWAAAQDPNQLPPPTEKEIALGRTLAERLESESGLLADPLVAEFLQGIAEQLARAAGIEAFLNVRILNSPVAEAHALPGGFLLIRSGLVAGVETTAELAGILAHQIGHIAARHGTRPVEPFPLGDNANGPMIYVGGQAGACLRWSAGPLVPSARRQAAGTQENEADSLALIYLDRAGYDPYGLVEAFDRLGVDEMPEVSRMTQDIRDRAREYSSSGRTYTSTSSWFVEIRERLPKPLPQQVEARPSLLGSGGPSPNP